MKKIIKKRPDKNEYILTAAGLWVRDFTKRNLPPIDVNRMTKEHEYKILIGNEVQNNTKNFPEIELQQRSTAVIVSSGYMFEEKHKLLSSMPSDVAIIGVNKSLALWSCPRNINYYVVNNPYEECMRFLPKKKALPRCIASTRTNPDFLANYSGAVYTYSPIKERHFGPINMGQKYKLDDYRNPICAAISFADFLGVKKLLLLCCDDSFDGERAGAEKLENGLWSYPQQQISRRLIDGCLYWMKKSQVEIFDHSSGERLENAAYIQQEAIPTFFKENDE